MASTRAYVRGSGGKFAGSRSGGKVTYGKAGGFANAGFRARVQASRASKAASRPPTKSSKSGLYAKKNAAIRGRRTQKRTLLNSNAKFKANLIAGTIAGGLYGQQLARNPVGTILFTGVAVGAVRSANKSATVRARAKSGPQIKVRLR